jgi:hypothetical protein
MLPKHLYVEPPFARKSIWGIDAGNSELPRYEWRKVWREWSWGRRRDWEKPAEIMRGKPSLGEELT